MGWMIGLVMALVGTNVWAWRVVRRLRRLAANDATTIARYQADEQLVREKVYEAHDAEWRHKSGLYCGIKYEECRPTAELVCDSIDELTFFVGDYRRLWLRAEEHRHPDSHNEGPGCFDYLDAVEAERAQARANLEETNRDALAFYHDASD